MILPLLQLQTPGFQTEIIVENGMSGSDPPTDEKARLIQSISKILSISPNFTHTIL
jgi:hypothetical protein